MFPFESDDQRRFRQLWDAVRIERSMQYSLFTFGDSDLPYYLILSGANADGTVTIRQGEVKISRARILTPDNMAPEFRNFFEESGEDEALFNFMLSRMAAFSQLKITNSSGSDRIVTDSIEEAVSKLNRRLDDDEEDRVGVISAPSRLAGFALMRYAAERVMESAPDNIQELRERGFLP